MTKTRDFSGYKLEGNPVEPTPVIGNITTNDLGNYILERVNARFKGKQGIEYPSQRGPISLSNLPRILAINQELTQLNDINIRPLTAREAITCFHTEHKGKLVIPERNTTYADTISVLLGPKEGENEDHKRRVMDILNIPNLTEPLVVNGLGVSPSNNEDGFEFEEADGITTEPFQEILKLAELKGVPIYQHSEQSGLRRLYRDRNVLNARDDRLLNANVNGRVQVVQDPKDSRADLEAKLREEASKMQLRLPLALEFLKTGSLENR